MNGLLCNNNYHIEQLKVTCKCLCNVEHDCKVNSVPGALIAPPCLYLLYLAVGIPYHISFAQLFTGLVEQSQEYFNSPDKCRECPHHLVFPVSVSSVAVGGERIRPEQHVSWGLSIQ